MVVAWLVGIIDIQIQYSGACLHVWINTVNLISLQLSSNIMHAEVSREAVQRVHEQIFGTWVS